MSTGGCRPSVVRCQESPQSASIGVAVRVDNADRSLRAGEYADARVQVDDPAPVLAIPSSAISSASGQEYAWTVERHQLRRRAITTGRRDPLSGLVEVIAGLHCDAEVIAMRFDGLREGATASIAASTVNRRCARIRSRAEMRMTRTAIEHPVFAAMVMLALCVLGLFSYQRLGVEQMPDTSAPVVRYPGASALAVESEIA